MACNDAHGAVQVERSKTVRHVVIQRACALFPLHVLASNAYAPAAPQMGPGLEFKCAVKAIQKCTLAFSLVAL